MQKNEKSKKALVVYLLFFVVMISFIAIAPFVAMHQVEQKTALSPKERIAR